MPCIEDPQAGRIVGPRVFSTGTILYGANMPGYKAEIDTLDDARFHVRRLADVGAISVKSYQQPRRDQRQMVLAAARELGMMVVPEGGANDATWEAARIRTELVRTQLREGADFAELAKRYSGDATAKDGGDLGTLKRGELAKDIESRILALQPGEVSEPFRSDLGYHIFRLETKETLEGEGLTRTRNQIREILFRQKYEARFDAWLREIRERAVIEVRM